MKVNGLNGNSVGGCLNFSNPTKNAQGSLLSCCRQGGLAKKLHNVGIVAVIGRWMLAVDLKMGGDKGSPMHGFATQ
jgi:hypothetical protein